MLIFCDGIFLNHEGSFGNQEGMITWWWLAELACVKLVSHFKQIFEKKFQKHIASELNTVNFFVLRRLALLVSQVSLSAYSKYSLNFVRALSFHSGKERFGFKNY